MVLFLVDSAGENCGIYTIRSYRNWRHCRTIKNSVSHQIYAQLSWIWIWIYLHSINPKQVGTFGYRTSQKVTYIRIYIYIYIQAILA
jgi:hypothetical protein